MHCFICNVLQAPSPKELARAVVPGPGGTRNVDSVERWSVVGHDKNVVDGKECVSYTLVVRLAAIGSERRINKRWSECVVGFGVLWFT